MLVGFVLGHLATAWQRDQVLGPLLDGSAIPCLGYSEPESGSDVAAAATTATRDGDTWVINGAITEMPEDFEVPARMKEPPAFQGPMKGDDIEYDYKAIRAAYYDAMQWNPETGKVVKCDYCKDRVDEGLDPACVTTCTTHCLNFGKVEDMTQIRRERHARTVASLEHCAF